MKSFMDADNKTIGKEVEDQFTLLISAINQSNAEAWQEYHSKEHFLSAIVNTDQYATRSAWVDTITQYFSMRDGQQVEPFDVHVTALTPDLALLTSQERYEMWPKDGKNVAMHFNANLGLFLFSDHIRRQIVLPRLFQNW